MVIDSIPPATTTSAAPALDEQVGQEDAVQTGEADLVDGGGRDRHGDPALHRRLPGRDLPLAGLQDLAHEDVVDLVGGHPGPLQGGGDGQATEVHGAEAGQGAGELADGGTGSPEDDGTGHENLRRRSAATTGPPGPAHSMRDFPSPAREVTDR